MSSPYGNGVQEQVRQSVSYAISNISRVWGFAMACHRLLIVVVKILYLLNILPVKEITHHVKPVPSQWAHNVKMTSY